METTTDAVARIADLAERLSRRFAQEDADERAHMRELCSPRAQQVLETMSVQTLHLLDAVPAAGENRGSVNVVGLAQATAVPKGTVSKTVRRLEQAGVLTRHCLPDNRKEVHLRLTLLGEEIRTAHRSLHAQMGTMLEDFLGRYTADELDVLQRILGDLLRMPREGVRFRPDLLD